ncbi:hypothetical protein [Aridibaculum aurantiacum]|uniref:hypothetical protein n=1 Tax=Aridibaculum aurantiacum TaxID=2810307 RepID=UPI001A97C84B|nr:hypothetical protein [Aridibaculum aurantiacum]
MKTLIIGICMAMGIWAQGQVANTHPLPKKGKDNYPQNSRQHTSPVKTSSRHSPSVRGNPNSPSVAPTPNDRPTEINRSNASNTNINRQGASNAQPNSPFVQGVYAAPNAARTFDTIVTQGPAARATVGTVVPGGNDTTFNVNTITTTEGVTTTSGAVDRSGQAQFGQTNWGDGVRNTVGESQWTIPPPITASFNREFPASNNAAWTRNQVDTNQYTVRYKAGTSWVTSTYDASGTRINMRTDIPLVQPPAPVSVFIAKQPATFQVASISRVQVQGRPEVYELRLANGKTTYVNTDGMEVRF